MSQPYRPLLPLHALTVRLAVDSEPRANASRNDRCSIGDALTMSSNATRVKQICCAVGKWDGTEVGRRGSGEAGW